MKNFKNLVEFFKIFNNMMIVTDDLTIPGDSARFYKVTESCIQCKTQNMAA